MTARGSLSLSISVSLSVSVCLSLSLHPSIHPSLSFIALGRSSRLHPVPAQSWCCVKLSCRLHYWWCSSVNSFKLQLCNDIHPRNRTLVYRRLTAMSWKRTPADHRSASFTSLLACRCVGIHKGMSLLLHECREFFVCLTLMFFEWDGWQMAVQLLSKRNNLYSKLQACKISWLVPIPQQQHLINWKWRQHTPSEGVGWNITNHIEI